MHWCSECSKLYSLVLDRRRRWSSILGHTDWVWNFFLCPGEGRSRCERWMKGIAFVCMGILGSTGWMDGRADGMTLEVDGRM